jgi:hypothetical protein
MIALFKTRYAAKKEAGTMIGWNIKIIKKDSGYAILCNGKRFLMVNGFVE